MNTPEREQLSQFLEQLTRVQAGPKDAEAQGMINRAMGLQPDAAYLLVQRALLQDGALKLAQDQIAELQEELNRLRQASPAQPSPSGGGFLDANAWGRNPARTPAGPGTASGTASSTASSYGAQQGAAQPAPQAAPAYYPPAAGNTAAPAAVAAPSAGFQAPSFLTSMATTAAGVAAGAFLFQGLGHLMGGAGHGGNAASAFGLSGPQTPGAGNAPQTEIVNNYFDTPKDSPAATADRGDQYGQDRLLDTSSADGNFDNVDDTAGLDFDASGMSDGSDDWA